MQFKTRSEWKDLLNIIRELSYEKRDVVLASGKKSDFYIDVKQTALNSKGGLLIGQLLSELITSEFPKATACGGITMGADPLSSSASVVSASKGRPLHAFYIRKEPKAHGTGRWIEGTKNLANGAEVVILEDVVTTGGSTLKSCERAVEHGLKILGIISIVDREEGGREAIEAAGYKFLSLFTKTDIVSK
jgi:orotate phosphoribosyltransferase